MNLQQLRFIRETTRNGFSLTRAAAALGTSQPALSRAILDLESELGLAVFLRHGKRIVGLTEPGRQVLERAERALAEVDAIAQVGAEFRSRDAGELRIATTHTQARYALPPVVAEFRQRYPAVRLTILQGSPKQISRLLLDREVDLAIATEVETVGDEIVEVPAYDWEHVVLMPPDHPLCAGELSLAALARFPLVTYVAEFAGRRRIDEAFEAQGLSPDVVLAAIDSDVIKTYVALGLGVGIMAAMAYDEQRDAPLRARAAGVLFGRNLTRMTVRRDAYLRGYTAAFIDLFAPGARLAASLPADRRPDPPAAREGT